MSTEILSKVRELHVSLAPKPRAKAAPASFNTSLKSSATSSVNHKKQLTAEPGAGDPLMLTMKPPIAVKESHISKPSLLKPSQKVQLSQAKTGAKKMAVRMEADSIPRQGTHSKTKQQICFSCELIGVYCCYRVNCVRPVYLLRGRRFRRLLETGRNG